MTKRLLLLLVLCISVAAGTASVTAQTNPNRFKVTTNIWQDQGNGKGTWKKVTPEGQWRYRITSVSGSFTREFDDKTDIQLEDGDYTVTLVGPTSGSAVATVYDFRLSSTGNSECLTSSGGPPALSLKNSDFVPNGTTHACAFLREASRPATNATVQKSFVSEGDGFVTWKLAPSAAADLQVWDSAAVTCTAHNGAVCGNIASGGAGSFSASQKDQYLLVTQPFQKNGDTCEVTNTAEFSVGTTTRSSVSATYKCSGASTLGWGLFVLFAFAAVSGAWMVQRKLTWSR